MTALGSRARRYLPAGTAFAAAVAAMALGLTGSPAGSGAPAERTVSQLQPSDGTGHPPGATRAATKATCPQTTLPSFGLPLHLHLSDHNLVPFGPGLLGVQATYRGTRGASVIVADGGYVDDLTENFDNLTFVMNVTTSASQAELFHGSFQGSPVFFALWRQPGQVVPCNVHSLTATGMSKEDVLTVLEAAG